MNSSWSYQTWQEVWKTMVNIVISCTFFVLALAGAVVGNLKKRTESGNKEGLHHVLLAVPGDDLGHCGGSLISAEWVLTAAHCNLSNVEVILGKHPGLKEERRKVTIKTQFIEQNIHHNIMLMKLGKEAPMFTTVKLPSNTKCTAPAVDTVVEYFAWIYGKYNFAKDKVEPEKLQKGELKVSKCITVPEDEKQPLPRELNHDKYRRLCATHPPNVDDCELFAGSPLMYKGVLHGVLSNYDFLCKKQVEFMDICGYRKWIKSVTKV